MIMSTSPPSSTTTPAPLKRKAHDYPSSSSLHNLKPTKNVRGPNTNTTSEELDPNTNIAEELDRKIEDSDVLERKIDDALERKIEYALERIHVLRETEELPAIIGGNDTLTVWTREISKLKAGKDEINTRALRLAFPDVAGRSPVLILRVTRAHEALHTLATAYETTILLAATTRPAPSSFARDWAADQRRHHDPGLLCLRPTERRSVPLRTFSTIFGSYIRRLGDPVPRNARGDAAFRAACALCRTMGDAFEDKADRSARFNTCVRAVFKAWLREYSLFPVNERCARVDFALASHLDTSARYPCLIREDRLEPGAAGDPYMQCARDYQLHVQVLKENDEKKWLALGAPTLLVSVVGASISVSGAFYDGESYIVEPLGPALWMLDDLEGARQRSLAQLLYSLDLTLGELVEYQARVQASQGPIEEQVYPPGIPRGYPPTSFRPSIAAGSLQGLDTLLHRAKPVQLSSHHVYLQSEVQGQKVLVKMLAASSPYGEKVHEALAAEGYAPAFYGAFRYYAEEEEEEYPVLYVMEYLAAEDGWVTLYEWKLRWARCGGFEGSRFLTGIRTALSEIVDVLEAKGMVHGDLRPANIMIQVEDEDEDPLEVDDNSSDGSGVVVKPNLDGPGRGRGRVKLKVIDFDWAGEVGTAKYPVNRNMVEIVWPKPDRDLEGGEDSDDDGGGEVGIGRNDDRRMVDIWWGEYAGCD